jgi:hypothetical protein
VYRPGAGRRKRRAWNAATAKRICRRKLRFRRSVGSGGICPLTRSPELHKRREPVGKGCGRISHSGAGPRPAQAGRLNPGSTYLSRGPRAERTSHDVYAEADALTLRSESPVGPAPYQSLVSALTEPRPRAALAWDSSRLLACGSAQDELGMSKREGLLRPEYSDWYPTLVSGVWWDADWLTATTLQQLRSNQRDGRGPGPAERMREGGAGRHRSCPRRLSQCPVHRSTGASAASVFAGSSGFVGRAYFLSPH